MYRQIIGYIPSNIVPAVISMVMIFAYTRFLSPAEFGSYTYVFSAVLVLQTSLFYALPVAVLRFYPGAVLAGRRDGLLKEAYFVFYTLCGLVVLLWIVIELFVDIPAEYHIPVRLALPLLLFRSLIQLNQAIHRSCFNVSRFNVIECLHAVLGLGLGFAALFIVGRGATAIVGGLLLAALLCTIIDLRLLMMPWRRDAGALDRAELVRLIEYSWPMVAVAATGVIMQNSDRFLLGSLGGTGMLGIFAVAYNLVDRPTTMICSSISTATFPLVVQVLEQQGKEAARLQAGRNGIALLAVALPTCVGLAFSADYVASSLVGPAFRAGVAGLIPIMSLTALSRGLRSHIIDHAFHLSGQPLMMLWTYAPATLLNIALNLVVIPRYGMFGAAWTALGCQAGSVVVGWFLGNALFPVWLPVWQVVRCMAAVVPMVIGLTLIRFPLNGLGLLAATLMGGALYLASVVALDVGDVRSLGWQALRKRLRPSVVAMTD